VLDIETVKVDTLRGSGRPAHCRRGARGTARALLPPWWSMLPPRVTPVSRYRRPPAVPVLASTDRQPPTIC